jgi:hypothetical protein
MEEFVDSINNGRLPMIHSSWQNMVLQLNEKARTIALGAFKENLAKIKLPMESDELE